MTILQSINASASPEVQMNENFESIEWSAVFGKRQPVTTGLTWGYYGGRWGGVSITAGTLSLTNAATNYVVVERSTGTISVSTASTNWDDSLRYARVYKLTTAGSVVTVEEDHRAGPYGVFANFPTGGLLVKSFGSPQDAITLTAAEALNETIEVVGSLGVETDLIVPPIPRAWIIFANTTGAGIRVINSGSPQSGVSIGLGKTAIVRASYNGVHRVTADNP